MNTLPLISIIILVDDMCCMVQEQDREFQNALRVDEERARDERYQQEKLERAAIEAASHAAIEAERQAKIAHDKDILAEQRATRLSLLPHEPV